MNAPDDGVGGLPFLKLIVGTARAEEEDCVRGEHEESNQGRTRAQKQTHLDETRLNSTVLNIGYTTMGSWTSGGCKESVIAALRGVGNT